MHEKHDTSYRLIFSYPQMVEDLLRNFVAEPWVDHLNFPSLEKVSERDVDARLVRREKDLLWRLSYPTPAGPDSAWLYIFIHLEFQSSIDHYMALREAQYKLFLWENLKRQGIFTGSGKLPPALSLTVYNGDEEWNAPLSLADLVEPLPGQTVSDSIMMYRIIDEQRYSAAELAQTPGPSAALFQLEKSRGLDDVRVGVSQLERALRHQDQRGLRDAFGEWLSSVLIPSRTSSSASEIPEVRDLMEIKTMLEQTVQKLTQQWKAEGLAEGRAEGRAEGKIQGQLIGRREALDRLLKKKFGPLPASAAAKLSNASLEHLEAWTDRILMAQSLDEVFDTDG